MFSRKNKKNDNYGEFPDFYAKFIAWIPVKIREWHLVIILVIFHQKWQFKLENDGFDISRNAT